LRHYVSVCLETVEALHTNALSETTSEDNLFSYKAQRWLWNEREQLQRRYVRFDFAALIRVVEDAISPDASCIGFKKLPEGNFNKTFIATMQDGREVIARLPNPNAGRPHYTIASEVATMAYVCFLSRDSIPVTINIV
jgi:hypothetical protein